MPLSYYLGMDDRNNTNRLPAMSPSVPPADHGIRPADHGISVPPPSHDQSNLLPPPIPLMKGKEKEKDESNVGGLLINLAENGSEDGTSAPTEKDAGTVPPDPTEKDTGTIPQVPTKNDTAMLPSAPTEQEASTTLQATTGKEAGMNPDKLTNPKQKGTPKPERQATSSNESSSSGHDDTKYEEYMKCFLEWLSLDSDCKRMLDNTTKMLASHKSRKGNKAIPIFQHTVDEDPELFTEAQAQTIAAVNSVRNGSGPSIRVRVRVGTEPEQDWRSQLLIKPNDRFAYGSIDISLLV